MRRAGPYDGITLIFFCFSLPLLSPAHPSLPLPFSMLLSCRNAGKVDFMSKLWTCPFCMQRNHFPPHYAENIRWGLIDCSNHEDFLGTCIIVRAGLDIGQGGVLKDVDIPWIYPRVSTWGVTQHTRFRYLGGYPGVHSAVVPLYCLLCRYMRAR